MKIKKKRLFQNYFIILFLEKKKLKFLKNFYLTKKDIIEMNKMNMLIGGHSKSHSLMTKLSKKKIECEIRKQKIFKKYMFYRFHFCYPYGGKSSYNQTIINTLKKYKFEFSISVENKDITNKDMRKKSILYQDIIVINFYTEKLSKINLIR